VFTVHPLCGDFEIPDDTVVWRYMSAIKFIDLLKTAELNMNRADLFEDKWEGKLSKANWVDHDVMYPNGGQALLEMKKQLELFRPMNYHVSSWSILPHESTALWSEYGGASSGVAIKSTWGKLGESLSFPKAAWGLGVKYDNYETKWIPEGLHFYPLLHKRNFFSFEAEARILIWSVTAEPGGNFPDGSPTQRLRIGPESIRVPLDLPNFADEFVFGAKMQSWEQDLLLQLISDCGVNIKSRISSLADLPQF
jgi:hypothetical protein